MDQYCLFTRKSSIFFVMDKWADFLISEVSYNSDHLISVAIRHQDT
jgi:hypothetical protein